MRKAVNYVLSQRKLAGSPPACARGLFQTQPLYRVPLALAPTDASARAHAADEDEPRPSSR